MTKLIIEHLEPKLWKWCLVEYSHISSVVGKEHVTFTNISRPADQKKLASFGKVYEKKFKELHFENVCILDPGAKDTLVCSDKKISYLLLGGILGDFPPRKRTKKELTSVLGLPTRNLGHYQMSTNTAGIVAWKILQGTPLSAMKFNRKLTVNAGDGEVVELPYRFLLENGKPLLAPGYENMVKKGF